MAKPEANPVFYETLYRSFCKMEWRSCILDLQCCFVNFSNEYSNAVFSYLLVSDSSGAMLNIVQDSALLEAIGCQMETVSIFLFMKLPLQKECISHFICCCKALSILRFDHLYFSIVSESILWYRELRKIFSFLKTDFQFAEWWGK